MDLLRRARRFNPLAAAPVLPDDEKPRTPHTAVKARIWNRLDIFRRPLRIRGNSAISIPLGVVILFPLIVVTLLLLFVYHPPSSSRILLPAGAPPAIRKISEKHDRVFVEGCLDVKREIPKKRANATIVILARNKELDGVIISMKSFERHFNRWFNYPYVFLNDGDFNSTFRETVANYTKAEVKFGRVGPGMWGYPDWIDPKVAKEGIAKQGDAAVMYGGLESYHSMCRFYSGFFFDHPLLQDYEWYWRVEPDVKYFCDLTYDPFLQMIENNKTYGFTIAVKELKETVPNIFRYASAYMRLNNLKSQGLWEMFIEPLDKKKAKEVKDIQDANDRKEKDAKEPPKPEREPEPAIDPETMEGEKYNMCHFWSNFEIARLSFFRSKQYRDFFEMMDRSGGFWMERWGDAPIHSLAAGALLSVKDIHYFRDIGYRHTTIQHCPANAPARQLPREPWLEETTHNEKLRREEDAYWENYDEPKENGVGCRCRCDTDIVDVEGKEGSCMPEWVEVAGGWV